MSLANFEILDNFQLKHHLKYLHLKLTIKSCLGIRRYQRGRQKSSEDRQNHGKQNETKDKHRTHDTTMKTKAGVTRTLQKTRVSSGAPEG